MSSIWIKTTMTSVALLSMAALPAFAQSEVQNQPTEAQEVPYGAERQSKPEVKRDTPRDLQLHANKKPPARCRYGGKGGTKADAVAYCDPILQCQPPKATHCQYRQNHQDWICWCK